MLKRLVIRFLAALRDLKLPGFRGAGLYDVLRFLLQALFEPRFGMMASAIAFNFFLATIPCLIFLFMILPYIPIKNFQQEILMYLAAYTPVDSFTLIQKIVHASFKKVGLGFILLNIFLILRPALRGILALMRAFKQRGIPKKKNNIIRIYIRAIVIFLSNLILFLLAILILNGGMFLIDYGIKYHLLFGFMESFLLKSLNLGITFVLLITGISIVYWVGGSIRGKWGFFSPGSILASTLLLLTLLALNYYFSNFGSYNKIYGGLATVIILLLWFYYIAAMILLGDELNYAIEQAERYQQKLGQNEVSQTL